MGRVKTGSSGRRLEQARFAFVQREPNAERGPPPYLALDFDMPTVRPDDALDDHQTQAGAFFFGGEERLKDTIDLFLRNAAAGVRHAEPNAIGAFAGLKRQRPPFGHRLERVFDEIDEHLLDLRRVNRGDGQLARQFVFHVHTAIVQFGPEQFNGFIDRVVDGGVL